MESLLQVLPAVAVSLDDILITGRDEKEHCDNLQEVLKRLKEAGLRLKREKCTVAAPSVVYLGHRIEAQGLHPTGDKLQALRRAPTATSVTELKRFFGLLNYYGKFFPRLASMLAPLYELLRKLQPWGWTKQQDGAFNRAKTALSTSRVLVHFDPRKPSVVICDASSYGVGAVLAHRKPSGEERPIAFVSHTLTEAEKNYNQIDKEGLALIFAVKKFHNYVFDRPFTLVTDHKAFLSLFDENRSVPALASSRMGLDIGGLSIYDQI